MTLGKFLDFSRDSRLGWWKRCTFEEFRGKLLKEAEHRPAEWRIGQFIFNRTSAIFPEEAESLRGGVHDCFYDDEKVDNYLYHIFDQLQNN